MSQQKFYVTVLLENGDVHKTKDGTLDEGMEIDDVINEIQQRGVVIPVSHVAEEAESSMDIWIPPHRVLSVRFWRGEDRRKCAEEWVKRTF